jgi:hypothetical protein
MVELEKPDVDGDLLLDAEIVAPERRIRSL